MINARKSFVSQFLSLGRPFGALGLFVVLSSTIYGAQKPGHPKVSKSLVRPDPKKSSPKGQENS